MTEKMKNRMRLGALLVIITSFVIPGPLIDDLSKLALVGLFADWAYKLYNRS